MAKELLLLDLPEFIFGAEGEGDDAGSDSQNSSTDSGNDSGESNESAGSGSGDEHDDDSNDDGESAGLRRALEAERAQNKANLKKLKAFEKAQEEAADKEKTESEREKSRAEKAESKLTKLAEGYRTSVLHAAIRKAAADFVDAEDVINALANDDSIGVEQDEDDPSDVTIDEKTVQAAVKKLATKKPHWLKTGTSDGERTGSQFGAGKGRKKPSGDDALKQKYPALQ